LKNAGAFGLDMIKFKECLDSGKHAEEIKRVWQKVRRPVLPAHLPFC
jgi:hypothetical protein